MLLTKCPRWFPSRCHQRPSSPNTDQITFCLSVGPALVSMEPVYLLWLPGDALCVVNDETTPLASAPSNCLLRWRRKKRSPGCFVITYMTSLRTPRAHWHYLGVSFFDTHHFPLSTRTVVTPEDAYTLRDSRVHLKSHRGWRRTLRLRPHPRSVG